MAYRRSVSTKTALLARQRFSFIPSFNYIHREDDTKHQPTNEDRNFNNFLQRRLFGGGIDTTAAFGALIRDHRCSRFSVSPMAASVLSRHMSTTIGNEADKIGYMTDVAEVISDRTVEVVASQVTPAANEVAIAAADSFFPVAGLQYLIDGVHSFTGLNWWAAIVVTTLLIRGATVPLLINQLKATTKLALMRPQLDEIRQEMQEKGMDPQSVSEGQRRMNALFKEYGVTPWTPLKGLFIQGPVFVCFFLAISNMVQKVPSFKGGGALWFTDLTTPDSLYIFPVLAGLTFWITVECNVQEGLEGNPTAGTMKKVSRVFALLTVPITMGFPKAVFCYWVTSNLFSLAYGFAIRNPGVKKLLDVPIIPVAPTLATAPKPALSFLESVKQYSEALNRRTQHPPTSSPTEAPKPTDHKISSTSVLSQRIRSLEKQVKGRKKAKKG